MVPVVFSPSDIGGFIRNLRKSLGLTQVEFAVRLGIDQGAVTNWERGKRNPSPEYLLKIASLTTDEALKRQLLEASGLAAFVPQSGTWIKTTAGYPTLNIRLLRDPAAAGTPRMVDEREVERLMVLPKFMFTEGSGQVVAIRVKGESMTPLILPGSIVFIDVSQRDPKQLVNAMVAARIEDGVTIKFLRKHKKMFLLVAYHVNPLYDVMPLSETDGDAIVGRVVGWFSEPPKK
jgi:transcriptional regulator with XRE-family HTH domain